LEIVVFEWDIHKYPFDGELEDLKKPWGKSKKAGREFPVIQWISWKALKALMESKW